MNLTDYDWIVISTSAGKDSQAMMDYVCVLAKEQGVLDRVIGVHADLGRVEWQGTKELAEQHCAHYGIPFQAVKREGGDGRDLLEEIEHRGKFPDSKVRYCTSYYKRDQVSKVLTRLAADQAAGMETERPVRILSCLGFRSEESPARAKRKEFSNDTRNTNGRRIVDIWLPIHKWTVQQVWARIKASGVKHHPAYDLGMPRLSCCFCIFAPKAALLLAGKHNPELLDAYVAVEEKIGHTFRHKQSLREIKQLLVSGVEPGKVADWNM